MELLLCTKKCKCWMLDFYHRRNAQMRDKYIEEFILSDEMIVYLKQTNHSIDKEADIIYHAPASLKRKKIALSELLDEAKKNGEQELIDDCEIYLRAIYEAERLMAAEGVFSVEISSYDAEKGDSDYEFDGLFNNFDDLVQYVKQNLEDYGIADDDPWFYQAVKWINDENGKLVEACTYWFVRGEVWFVDVDDNILDDYRLGTYGMINLNLPVPFKAGDIVEVDLYPFADKRIIEISEVGDNLDCCCLQAIGKSVDGAWHVGAIKHGHFGIDVLPCVSPLYTMKIYKDELPPDFKILESISNFIDGREENGTMLWNALAFASETTDEEILACLEKMKEVGKHD